MTIHHASVNNSKFARNVASDMNFIILTFLFYVLIENTIEGKEHVFEAETFSYSHGCNKILPRSLINEIASYKFLIKILMNVINSKDNIDEFYRLYTTFIDKFGARPSGSQALESAIDHMVNLTFAYGLDQVKTEDVTVPRWVRGEEKAYLFHPREKRLAILGLGESVPTVPEGITAEAIVVKSFKELESLRNEYVKGKIVIFNPEFTTYGETVVYRHQGASIAASKGAVATLIRSITPFSLYTPHTGSNDYAKNATKIPTAAITVEDADLLERFFKDRQLLIIHLLMSSSFDYKVSRNTLIDLKGKKDPNKLVIVSGHIDSWDVGQGALDNGGGMFISWYAPIVLHRLGLAPKRTLRSILWTAEEYGMIGSRAYLEKHFHELHNIIFMLESDEGTFKPLGLEVGGSLRARCIIAEILKLFSPIDKILPADYPGSDSEAFLRTGIPGASLLNQNERYFLYHHTEADTISLQKKEELVACAAFWAAISYIIADLSVDIPKT